MKLMKLKKKREKLRCLLLSWKNIFYIYDVITWGEKKALI